MIDVLDPADVDDETVEPAAAPDPLAELLRAFEPMTWARYGACRGEGPDDFFADPQERPEPRALREQAIRERFCNRCPVAVECRAHARRIGEHGFWGGEGEHDRAALGIHPPVAFNPHIVRVAKKARRALGA